MKNYSVDILVDLLKKEIPWRLDSPEMMMKDANPRNEDFIIMFLRAINELGYVILPRKIEASSEDIVEFEASIRPWARPESDDTEVIIEGAAILQDLASKGWLLIPEINS